MPRAGHAEAGFMPQRHRRGAVERRTRLPGMADHPRLRPSQWALLERFIAIERRLEADPNPEPIAVGLFDQARCPGGAAPSARGRATRSPTR